MKLQKNVKSAYERNYKPFYEKHRAEGWKTTMVFGPPILIEAVKEFTKKFKKKHGLYIREP